MEGTVKFYNRKNGFGFISGEDGSDYFVHFTALPKGLSLRDNDKVSFNPVKGDRGLKAENVQLLQKASERPEGTEQQDRPNHSREQETESEEDDSDDSDESSEETDE